MDNNRRRFFRINDTIGLKITPIDIKTEQSRIDDFCNNQHDFSIRNEYNFQLAQHQADLQQIAKKMPELARYLVVMQKQIDLLTENIVPEQNAFNHSQKNVNLSAQGISFQSQEKLEIGLMIELHMQLLPSGQQIVLLSRVIKCETQKSSENTDYLVSLNFDHIHEADQEILVKHVHSKQFQQISENQLDQDG